MAGERKSSVRLGQAETGLGDEVEEHLPADRGDPSEPDEAEHRAQPILTRQTIAAVGLHRLVDSMDGDSARGDWGGEWSGAVRPLLSWGTRIVPSGEPDSGVARKRESHVS